MNYPIWKLLHKVSTAVTILKGYISCIFNEKMRFDERLGDISFCINSILIIPKHLAIDLYAYWLWSFDSPSVLSDLTCKGYWISYLKGIEWKNENLISKINKTLFMYNYLCFLEIPFSIFHEDIFSSICFSSREITNTKTDNSPSLRKELNKRF